MKVVGTVLNADPRICVLSVILPIIVEALSDQVEVQIALEFTLWKHLFCLSVDHMPLKVLQSA